MLQTINVREAVQKRVVRFGNGSIVYTPKKWIGEQVLVILEEKHLDIKGEAVEAIKPYLGSVVGIFLFGSFARNEQTADSDIDILVIVDKKIPLEKKGRFDFLVKTREQFEKEARSDPTLFLHQVASEAKPILNETLLKQLKQVAVKPDFEKFLDDTLGAFKKTTQSLESQKGSEFLQSNASIYSLILRLKSLFLIQCFKQGSAFSNKKFKGFIKKHGFSEKAVEEFMEVYRAERDEKKTSIKIQLADAEKLFDAAKKEFLKTEEMVKK